MSALDPDLREQVLGMAAADQDARRRVDRHPRLDQGVPEQQLTAAEREDLERLLGGGHRQHRPDEGDRRRARLARPQPGWRRRRPGGLAAGPARRPRPGFQRACLELLGQAVQAGEAEARHHAYLTDRVLLAEGSNSCMGPFMLVGGAWQPRPLADPDRVDARRRRVGLEPLADYRRRLQQCQPQGGEDQAAV